MRTRTAPGAGSAIDRLGYLAVPVQTAAHPGPWPAVVVIHEALGPTDDMHEQCDWFAAAGYLALMPDLYHGKTMIRCVRSAIRQLAEQRGPVFEQLEAARVQLAARDDCTGAVGVAGYCLGGGFALLLAGSCPIAGSYGGRDRLVPPGAAAVLDAALQRAAVAHDVREYPAARHAFISRNVVPSPLTTIGKVLGVGYHHDSAADAKRRILAFFDTHLRPPVT
jgi:carboxymethylenebutenolidase